MRIPNEKGQLGKYDEQTVRVLRETKAAAAAVIVIGGNHGSGFSFSCIDPKLVMMLPDLLEEIAADMREQNKAASNS